MHIPVKLDFEGDVAAGGSTKFTANARAPFRADTLSIHPACAGMEILDISVGLEQQLVSPVPVEAFSHVDVNMSVASPGMVVAVTVGNPSPQKRRLVAVLFGLYAEDR